MSDSLSVFWSTYKWCAMVFGGGRKKEGVGLFPSLALCAGMCTAQRCKDGPQKEGDQLSAMSGLPVEIRS